MLTGMMRLFPLSSWMRNLHLYLGLFVSPFLVVFALSAILVNHGWRAPDAAAATHHQVAITLPDGLKDLGFARSRDASTFHQGLSKDGKPAGQKRGHCSQCGGGSTEYGVLSTE